MPTQLLPPQTPATTGNRSFDPPSRRLLPHPFPAMPLHGQVNWAADSKTDLLRSCRDALQGGPSGSKEATLSSRRDASAGES